MKTFRSCNLSQNNKTCNRPKSKIRTPKKQEAKEVKKTFFKIPSKTIKEKKNTQNVQGANKSTKLNNNSKENTRRLIVLDCFPFSIPFENVKLERKAIRKYLSVYRGYTSSIFVS